VVLDDRQLTYRELDAAANRLARALVERGVQPETLVGLCHERSLAMVVSVLGIWKAAGAYVPLDPDSPTERLRQVVAETRPRLLVTSERVRGRLPTGVETILVDDDHLLDEDEPPGAEPPRVALRPQHLAYVIYTSGSTGRSKGVLIEHGGLANLCDEQARVFAMRPEDRVLQLSSLCFDASVFEMAMALAAGATLCLIPSQAMFRGATLLEVLRRQRVSCMTIVPSVLRLLPSDALPDLTTIIAAGEDCPAELVERWAAEGRRFFNAYGPTETTVWATTELCRPGAGKPAIGAPIGGTYALVLDERLRPVAVGTPGELYLGGVHLARGYLHDPQQTEQRFLPDPTRPGSRVYRTGDQVRVLPDGRIVFLGRTDHQIKLRGFRIDPAEIEETLAEHPSVAECLVRCWGEDRKVLVAYVVPSPGASVTPAALKEFLGRRLPSHMVPTHFCALAAMPLTRNGKVDRDALVRPERPPSNDSGDPRDDRQKALARLFAAVLGLEAVGLRDRFFDDLGGDSLAAVDLLTRIEQELGLSVPMRLLFDHDTVEKMTAALEADGRGEPAPTVDWAGEGRVEPELASTLRRQRRAPHLLLTGATGFVGAFLLEELLRRTDARIVCLVRARGADEAGERVRAALHRWGIWRDAYQERIEPLAGDISDPHLGVPGEYAALASLVERVYHCAATVNFVYPYRRLKAVNVDGTRNLIRFAGEGRAKSLHHISSMAVYGSVGYFGWPCIPEDELEHIDTLYMGYAESKAVAELLVRDAGRSGLPATIYRLDDVIGHSRTGVWNTSDFVCRYLKGALELGLAPDLDLRINAVPVDTVARIIGHASTSPGSLGRCLNVSNPQGVDQARLFEHFARRGHPLRLVAYREWQQALRRLGQGSVLRPLVPLFTEQHSPHRLTIPEMYEERRRPRFSDANLRAALAGSGIVIPALDDRLFARYYRYFVDCGFLAAAAGAVREPPTLEAAAAIA